MNQFIKSQMEAYERRENIKFGAFGNDPDFVEQVTRGFYTSSNPFRLKYPLTVGKTQKLLLIIIQINQVNLQNQDLKIQTE